jgi:hypothetical protein
MRSYTAAIRPIATALILVPLSLAGAGVQAAETGGAAGAERSFKTDALVLGAKALQRKRPVNQLDVHLVGPHPLKADPHHQMMAHHFCEQVNEDFAQCVLYDGNGEDARLNGIEYIISKKLFEQLPPEERQYWHPHNGEILSGLLVAPGLPEAAEHALMKSKINSYGKTWHTWLHDKEGAATQLPLGEPALGWSINRQGEADAKLVEQRDREHEIDSAERARQRQDLVELAEPQQGVDALRGQFGSEGKLFPGVSDAGGPAAEREEGPR